MVLLRGIAVVVGSSLLWASYRGRAVIRRIFGALSHRAPLGMIDRISNVVAALMLPLWSIGLPDVSNHENLQRLKKCRSRIIGLDTMSYERGIKKHWTVESVELPVCSETGDSTVSVLIHKPVAGWSVGAADTPMIIWAHGGGLTLGQAADGFAAGFLNDLAPGKAFCWASVDYRLAPEHMYPASVDDVVAACEHFLQEDIASKHGYNSSRVCLAGVSAGALLAALASSKLAAKSAKPAYLMLMTPMLDPFMRGASWKQYGELPMCPASWLAWSWRAWLTGDATKEPSDAQKHGASPVLLDWSPYSGNKMLLVNSRFDPFTDDNSELLRKLKAASLDVTHVQGGGCHCIYDDTAKKAILAWFVENV